MTRPARIALEVGAGFFALAALVAVIAALRLAGGTLPLDPIAPYLAAALSDPAHGLSVGIDHAFVTLDAGPRLALVARGVRLGTAAGGPQVTLPQLSVDLSLKAALGGVIAPTRIVLDRPRLVLTRDPAGSFHLGLGGDAAAASTEIEQWLRDLAGARDPEAPLGRLREVAIHRAGLVFDDEGLGVQWRAGADLVLRRDARGLSAKIALAVADDPTPSPIAATLTAAYDPARGRVTIENATLDLGGPRLAASGTIDGIGGLLAAGTGPRALEAALALDAHDVPVAALPKLWPGTLAPAARDWIVAHVPAGIADRATAALGLHLDLAPAARLAVTALSGTIACRGMTIAGLGRLPPLHNIDGTGNFDRAGVMLQSHGGTILGLSLSGGSVALDGLDGPKPRAAITVALAGPVKDALAVLKAAPLGALPVPALSADGVAGDLSGHVGVQFPLVPHPDLRRIGVTADASLTGLAARHAVLGRDLSDGSFRLRLRDNVVQLDGRAAIAGVPMALTLRRSLAAKPKERLHATLSARLDEAARRALGLDVAPKLLSGTIGLDLAYTQSAAGAGVAEVALDLGAADLALPPLGWRKRAGTKAGAELTLTLDGTRVTAIRTATISGGGLKARFSAEFAADGRALLSRVDVAELAVGATDASVTAVKLAGGGWRLTVAGRSFDAAALIDELDRAPPGGPPLELDATLGRLVLGPGRAADAVRAELASDGIHWQAASIDATLPHGAPVRLRFGMVAGKPSFDLHTDDFGGLLHLLGLYDNVEGGRLQLTGTAVDDGKVRRLRLAAAASDYRLVNAPLMARLLSLASFSGLGALLSGEGIPFRRLSADLVYGRDRIDVADFRTYGGGIGITASGTIDRGAGLVDLSGTLVPAYRLNSILGNIPLIGDLLQGGAGQGIFGANYRIAGAIDDPKIALNPLSALAPGVLRNLFLFAPGNPAAADAR